MNQPLKSVEDELQEIAAALTGPAQEADSPEAACSRGRPIPHYRMLVQTIDSLRTSLFPRFAERSTGQSGWTAEHLARHHLERATSELAELICEAYVTAGRETPEQPMDLALEFARRLPAIRNDLLTDMQAAFEGDPACESIDEVVLCYPGFTATTVYRLAHQLHRMKIPLLPRMMTEWAHGETGIDIHPAARIGRHFFLDHGTGVVIGETCVIGERVKIYQGVTLGALSFPTDHQGKLVRNTKRHPSVEDRVVIYANATVLGGDTVVGHDSVIGSSVWLTRSVDPFTTVVMEKPNLRIRNQTPSEFEPPLDFQI